MKTGRILLALLFLTSCASPAPRPKELTPAQQKQIDKSVILNSSAKGFLRVVGIQTDPGPDGILRFQVDVQNTGKTAKTFLYQVDWFDRDGDNLGISTAPLPWTLLRQEFNSLTITAPTPLAKDFRLTFSLR